MSKIFQIKAQSGQSQPVDVATAQALTLSSGTLTLVNDATYGYIWRLVGGIVDNANLTGLGTYGEGFPLTVVCRFRVTNRQAAFTRWVLVGATANDCVTFGNNGGGGTGAQALRIAPQAGGTIVSGQSSVSKNYVAGDVLTVVCRMQAGTTDVVDFWYQTTGRTGTAPDETKSASFAYGTAARKFVRLNAAAGETLDLIDLYVDDQALSDALCAQAADSIDTFLGPSSSAVTRDLTASYSIVASPLRDLVATYSLGDTASRDLGVSYSIVNAVQRDLAGTYSVATSGATFTSPPLVENTGALRANKALSFVRLYNDTTGALVVEKTGISTDSAGVFSFFDSTLVPGTFYRPDWEFADGVRGMPRKAAA